MNALSKLFFWRKAEPIEMVSGFVESLEPMAINGVTLWTLQIRYPSEPAKALGEYEQVSGGVEYWSVPLSKAAVSTIRAAQAAGDMIGIQPKVLRSLGCHEVPWQGFKKMAATAAND